MINFFKEDACIAVMASRSIELIQAVLYCVHNENIFVSLDPSYPDERIKYIIADTKCRVIIINRKEDGDRLRNIGIDAQIIHADTLPQIPVRSAVPSTFSYVLYTSGSTGNPKGVFVSGKALLNTLEGFNKFYPTTSSDTWLFKTPHTFDVSMTEIFLWHMFGSKIVVLPEGYEKDPQKIIDTIFENEITHINFVPSMFKVFLLYLSENNINKISSLKYIFLAGEELTPAIAHEYKEFNLNAQLINLYGPTEAAVYASHYNLSDWNEYKLHIPIGKALPNFELMIVDEYNQRLPFLIPGEICIGGMSLANGYLNNERLTDLKFIQHPENPSEKIYKTGDKGRMLLDGNIEFFGRLDDQIKLRGYRIEIGELECVLLKHKNIQEAAVVLDASHEDHQLVAFYTSDKENELSRIDLQSHLKKYVPEYMIPFYFVHVEKMPRTSSEKIDKNALRKINYRDTVIDMSEEDVAEDETLTEKQLKYCINTVLHLSQDHTFRSTENIFRVGLTSLTLIKLKYHIKKYFEIDIELSQLYIHSTIKEISILIDTLKRVQESVVEDREILSI